jgi:hypothetical protein
MSLAHHDVSRGGPDLHRVDRVATPRWLREHRRARARAARPDAVAATLAEEMLRHNLPGRELTVEEIIKAQGVKPFNWEEHKRRQSLLTSEDWAELRAALGLGTER